MVVTDLLASLPFVDHDRIGAIGHSAGGHNLVFHMFLDRRIKCGVSSCGLFSVMNFYAEYAPKRRLAAYALPELERVGDSADYLAMVTPRAVRLTRGLWEWGTDGADRARSEAHVRETREIEARAREAYAEVGSTGNLEVVYFDEAGGNHDFPIGVRTDSYAWLERQLGHGRSSG